MAKNTNLTEVFVSGRWVVLKRNASSIPVYTVLAMEDGNSDDMDSIYNCPTLSDAKSRAVENNLRDLRDKTISAAWAAAADQTNGEELLTRALKELES